MEKINLTELQRKSRRNRNIALGVVLALLVVMFYAITIIKMVPAGELMMGNAVAKAEKGRRGNLAVLFACGAFVAGMVGMSYAAVPLYSLYCKVTGYNGTTQRAEQASDRVLDQSIRVELDSNTAADLNWDFKPVDLAVEPRIGETMTVNFTVTNNSSREKTGQAVFNVTPMAAGVYFNKLECFCFTDVTLKPGETRQMPVVFFVDPDIVKQQETKDLKVLTLSYTFYSRDKDKPVADAKKPGEGEAKKL